MDLESITSNATEKLKLEEQIANLQTKLDAIDLLILTELPIIEEGTNTVNVGKFKIKTKTPIGRKVDPELWETIRPELPEALQGVITEKSKTDLALNLKMYRALETVQPDVFTLISKCITATPGTVSLTISEIEL